MPSMSGSPSGPFSRSPNSHGNTKSAPSLPENPHFHPNFENFINHFRQAIAPMTCCVSGKVSPDFPSTVLAYHLLTHSQLDNLARFFHQVYPPMPETYMYPARIPPWVGTPEEADVDVDTKRHRFGFFIGLLGCELTPAENFPLLADSARIECIKWIRYDDEKSILTERDLDAQAEEVLAWMEHEWGNAMDQTEAEQNGSGSQYGWK